MLVLPAKWKPCSKLRGEKVHRSKFVGQYTCNSAIVPTVVSCTILQPNCRKRTCRNSAPAMRRPAGSSSSGGDGDERLGLTANEGLDDEGVLAAAAEVPRRRPKRRGCLRVVPWLLLAAVAVTSLLAMPGGLSVFLCACRMRGAPRGDGIVLVGHRGSEWPLPGNTLRALRVGARSTHFVHLDAAISRDGVAYVADGRLEHTTNGSGKACVRPSDYLDHLVVSPPTHDPQLRAVAGRACRERAGNRTRACTYRVPTLESVFADLPARTRFMLQIDACESKSRPRECPPCLLLVKELKKIVRKHFIAQDRLYFIATSGKSTVNFMNAFPDATFLMAASHEYAHYSPRSFARKVRDSKFDGVAMTTTLVGWRPDLGYRVERERAHRTTKKLVRYAMTVGTDWDAKIALCAGVSKLVVSEPFRLARLLRYKWERAWRHPAAAL